MRLDVQIKGKSMKRSERVERSTSINGLYKDDHA